MSDLVEPQPAPQTSEQPAVWPLVVADMEAKFTGPDVGRIVGDMINRDAFGLRKYGTRLQAHNGRDPLVDAYQEALDLAVYLRTAIAEGRESVRPQYLTALRLVMDLRRTIDAG